VLGRNRKVVFRVDPVADAAGYQFEFTGMRERKSVLYGSVMTTLVIPSVGSISKGKWRVSAIHDGLKSRPSPWRRFVVRTSQPARPSR
jgi:hypothetical protein